MMKNIYTLSVLTFREALSRKIFVFFFGVSTFVLFLFAVLFMAISPDSFSGMGTANVAAESAYIAIARGLKLFITIPLFGGGLFISIFSVANFIPQMTEKGSIDLLLSKPVSRAQIILGKFIGGTTMVFVNIAYLIVGLWILIGFKFGDWDPTFLLATFTITFAFALLYSLIILIGIITKSSVVSMVVSYLIFFIISPLLANRDSILSYFSNSVLKFILELLHYITPQTSELSTITSDLAAGNSLLSVEPIVTSFILLIVLLSMSIMIFNKKDY